MNKQEEIKIRLNHFIESCGVSQRFIANKIFKDYGEEIPLDVLSRFKTGKREMWDNHLELIDKFLIEHNF